MTFMGIWLVTSIAVALTFILHNGASTSGSTPEEDEPASASSLSTSIADVMLVSYRKPWNEAHSTFARLLGGPITTWHVRNPALRSYFLTSITPRGKRPIFVVADPGEPFETMQTLRGAQRFGCLPWLFVRHHSQTHTHSKRSWPRLLMCDVVGVLGMNSSTVQNILWPLESSLELNPSSKKMLGKLRIAQYPNVKSLSGKRLSVACRTASFKRDANISCYTKRLRKIFALLNAKNVTVHKVLLYETELLFEGLYANKWNMVADMIGLSSFGVNDFDFPFIFLSHKTFYSRMESLRLVTIAEVARESWKIASITVFLLALLAMVTVPAGQGRWSVLRGFSDTLMFLVAALLANSALEPSVLRREVLLRKSLLGVSFLAMLPLSVYFRSELTSMVTLRRPAYRIDTLQKLEDALDRREVAPCAVIMTEHYYELAGGLPHPSETSLMKKLRFAFARHGDRALAVGSGSECLRCASKRGRVCYNSLQYLHGRALKRFPNVRPFVEHLQIKPIGYVTHKFLDLYKPLRRFFHAVEEHRLITSGASERDHVEAETRFDASSLFVQLVVLHAASCFFLLLEVLVARCLRPASPVRER